MEFKEKFFNLVSPANSILITTHKDPDADAICSLLALFFVLSQKYPDKDIQMMVASLINPRFSSFANFEKVQQVKDLAEHMAKFDLVIMLDASYDQRFTENFAKYHAYAGKRIAIDHHPDKGEKFDLKLIDENVTSTAELLYFNLLSDEPALPAPVGAALLAGLMADTGNFTYLNASRARVLGMAERLVREGDINVDLLTSLFSGYSERVFELLKHYMGNAKIEEISGWPKFIYSYLDRQFFEAGNFTTLETEEATGLFTDYLRALHGVPWGFVARNYGPHVKVSFRSAAKSVSVRAIAQGLGRGSGHEHAAGAKFLAASGQAVSVDEAILAIKNWLNNNSPVFLDF